MAEIKWEAAKDLILPLIKDCPWPMARQALIRAAREFYRDTLAWASWSDDVFTIAGLDEYAPYAGSNVEVVRILKGLVGTTEYVGANERDFGLGKIEQSKQNLMSWYEDAIHLYPMPVIDDLPVKAYMAVRPTWASTGLPKEQWKHIDWLIEGALEKLHMTAGKPYTDMKEGLARRELFRIAKGKARSDTAKGGYAKQRVAGHYF